MRAFDSDASVLESPADSYPFNVDIVASNTNIKTRIITYSLENPKFGRNSLNSSLHINPLSESYITGVFFKDIVTS